jgi:hypothetical protein
MSTTLTTTKLYDVTSVIDEWPHRGSLYNGVQVTWFVDSRDTDPRFDYAAMLEGYELTVQRDYRDLRQSSSDAEARMAAGHYERRLVDDLFTEDEAAQLAAHLNIAYGTEVEITEKPLPIATMSPEGYGYISVSSIPYGPVECYELYKHDDYNLPFRVCGYYDMRQEPAPLRVEDKRGGEWVPVDPPEPYSYPGYDFMIQATPAVTDAGSGPF